MSYKILFISSWYPNKLELTNGNFVQRHAQAVATLHKVEVLHAIGDPNQTEKYFLDEQVIDGVRTVIVYYRNSKNPIKNFIRRMRSYQKGFAKMQKPDLVHANVLHNNLFFAIWLKKKLGIPFVVSEHWTSLQLESRKKTSKKILKTAQIIGNQASYIFPVSENLKKGLQSLPIHQPMKIISNVVNTEIFSLGENHQNTQPHFLHVSSLIPRKKVDKIIETAKKLHDSGYRFTLEVGGDGEINPLNQLIQKLNAQSYISTFGEQSYAEVAEKMKKSDCFILFSENETQGCVLLESFACGKPVIATKVGGVPEFVKENYGILIDRNDEEALFEAMKSVIEGKSQFVEQEKLRQFVVDNYSKQAIAKQFTKIYTQILK